MLVLLVEDSEDVREIAVEYLHELGHEVVGVGDAEEALARLLERGFDAVMTDVRLPGMSGIALTEAITERYPALPVVISSGYGGMDPEFLFRRKMPKVFVLPKPYDLAALDQVLGSARRSG